MDGLGAVFFSLAAFGVSGFLIFLSVKDDMDRKLWTGL
jgi:hypothetical protein